MSNKSPDIREQWAAATQSSHLEHDDEREVAIDRIAAAAFGPAIGRVLWRMRYAGEVQYAPAALQMVAGRFRRQWGVRPGTVEHMLVTRVTRQALKEWWSPQCRVCRGRGEIEADDLRIVCDTCSGQGIQPYGEPERRKAVMGPPGVQGASWALWERRVGEVLGYLLRVDDWVAHEARRQLERRTKLIEDPPADELRPPDPENTT